MGVRRAGVPGALEVLGVQNRITRGEPSRCLPMQRLSTALQQGIVHAIANQGVREQQLVADRPQQKIPHQVGAVVMPLAEQMTKSVGGEPLAEHRRRLQGLPVGRR
jgi:hypothetical protein